MILPLWPKKFWWPWIELKRREPCWHAASCYIASWTCHHLFRFQDLSIIMKCFGISSTTSDGYLSKQTCDKIWTDETLKKINNPQCFYNEVLQSAETSSYSLCCGLKTKSLSRSPSNTFTIICRPTFLRIEDLPSTQLRSSTRETQTACRFGRFPLTLWEAE